jgi:hypothetical protein
MDVPFRHPRPGVVKEMCICTPLFTNIPADNGKSASCSPEATDRRRKGQSSFHPGVEVEPVVMQEAQGRTAHREIPLSWGCKQSWVFMCA